MNFAKKLVNSIKYLGVRDFVAPFILLVMLPCVLAYRFWLRLQNRRIWLVCEDGINARDNGYYFFKYMREKHPSAECYFVIDKKSPQYQRVKRLGNVLQFRSLKHWLYYLVAEYNIVSQKKGNPNQPLFYVLHVYFGKPNNRVYLKHGVVKDRCEWLFYQNTKYRYFICGARNEYEYVKSTYGYPSGAVVYTGLARYDTLHSEADKQKTILVMPTWRNWLGRETNALGAKTDFKKTPYYQHWTKLLDDPKLIKFIEKNEIILAFYPHVNMQKYLKDFKPRSKSIKILDVKTDIQTALKKSAMLITDYSSVYMDFAYMQKPVIYYQFDYDEFRARQYQEGYFNYGRDGFGPVCKTTGMITTTIIKSCDNNFRVERKYLERMKKFFEVRDRHNCDRIYQLLTGSEERIS